MILTWYPSNGRDPIVFTTNDTEAEYLIVGKPAGFTEPSVYQQTTRHPNQSGSTWLGAPFNDRELSFDCWIQESNQSALQVATRTLMGAFAVQEGPGTLVWTQEDGTDYTILAIGNPGPVPYTDVESAQQNKQKFNIKLIAHDPYWYSGVWQRSDFSSTEVAFFPFDFPFDFTGEDSPLQQIENEGDYDTPVYLLFTGPLTNPSFYNGTINIAVTLTMTIAAGETVEIYTAKDEQYAIYHATAGDTSAFPYLDYDTNLSDMVLKPGTNDCELDTDSSGTGSSLMVQWRHKYGGI